MSLCILVRAPWLMWWTSRARRRLSTSFRLYTAAMMGTNSAIGLHHYVITVCYISSLLRAVRAGQWEALFNDKCKTMLSFMPVLTASRDHKQPHIACVNAKGAGCVRICCLRRVEETKKRVRRGPRGNMCCGGRQPHYGAQRMRLEVRVGHRCRATQKAWMASLKSFSRSIVSAFHWSSSTDMLASIARSCSGPNTDQALASVLLLDGVSVPLFSSNDTLASTARSCSHLQI